MIRLGYGKCGFPTRTHKLSEMIQSWRHWGQWNLFRSSPAQPSRIPKKLFFWQFTARLNIIINSLSTWSRCKFSALHMNRCSVKSFRSHGQNKFIHLCLWMVNDSITFGIPLTFLLIIHRAISTYAFLHSPALQKCSRCNESLSIEL